MDFFFHVRALRYPLIFLGRTACFVIGFHYLHTHGKQAAREEAPLLVLGPHSTFLDAIVCFACGLPTSVSRAENVNVPFFDSMYIMLQKKGKPATSCSNIITWTTFGRLTVINCFTLITEMQINGNGTAYFKILVKFSIWRNKNLNIENTCNWHCLH